MMRRFMVVLAVTGVAVRISAQTINADCVTVTAAPPQEPALTCAAKQFGKPPRHGNTVGALSNVLTCVGNRSGLTATIIGHGNSGGECTNLACGIPDRRLARSTYDDWKDALGNLRSKLSEIVLLACDTGLGDGPNLVAEVATRANAVVYARTGFVGCTDAGGFSFEENTEWLRSDQNGTVTRIRTKEIASAPSEAAGSASSPRWLQHMTAVTMRFRIGRRKDVLSVKLGTAEVADLSRFFTVKPLFRMQGYPLALRTGDIVVHSEGRSHVLPVFNGRLALDETTHSYFSLPIFDDVRRHILQK